MPRLNMRVTPRKPSREAVVIVTPAKSSRKHEAGRP
jgi:hypothetical protein|eukprot:SAG25_NODE_235_length_11344_cov_3.848911_6_plen_36_part_00